MSSKKWGNLHAGEIRRWAESERCTAAAMCATSVIDNQYLPGIEASLLSLRTFVVNSVIFDQSFDLWALLQEREREERIVK